MVLSDVLFQPNYGRSEVIKFKARRITPVLPKPTWDSKPFDYHGEMYIDILINDSLNMCMPRLREDDHSYHTSWGGSQDPRCSSPPGEQPMFLIHQGTEI
jgi:hypothetical protein